MNLRVFENRILWRIFGPKRVENGEWRRLHNEELNIDLSVAKSLNFIFILHSSQSIHSRLLILNHITLNLRFYLYQL